MADKEPVGLDMSLDDLISKSNDYPKFKRKVGHDNSDGSKKEFRCFNCDTVFVTSADLYNHKDGKCDGKKMYQCFVCKEILSTSTELYQHKASGCSSMFQRKINCFTCRNVGILTDFGSMEELHEHRNSMHPTQQKLREPTVETVTVNYIWSGEGTNDEALCVEHLQIWLIRIYSSGDVHVNGNIEHTNSLFTILNTCLAPVNLKINFTTDISGLWTISNESGGWTQPLENVKRVSAFTRRAWHIIRSKLDNLPVAIKISSSDQNSNINTFKRQRQLPTNNTMTFTGPGRGYGGRGGGAANTMMSPMMANSPMDPMSMPFLGMPMQMPLMPMMMMQQMANMAQLQSMAAAANSSSNSGRGGFNTMNSFRGGENGIGGGRGGRGGGRGEVINPFMLPNQPSVHFNPANPRQGMPNGQPQVQPNGQPLGMPQYSAVAQQSQQQQYQGGFSGRGGRGGSYRGGRGRGRR